MQHHPTLNPNPNLDPYFSHAYMGYSIKHNSNSETLNPPVHIGVDTHNTLVQPYPPRVDPPYVPQQGHSFNAQQPVVAANTAVPYYQEPNAAAVQNWVAAVWQLGTSLGAAGVTVPSGDVQNTFPANTTSAFWTNPAVQSQRNASWKKTPKKTKVVQSAWCEVCKIECNSKDVFDQHKLGKKHKKNMEKLNGITSTFVAASASFIGPQEKQDKEKATGGQKAQKRVAQQMEDLETKRRKVLEGGAAADAVRACVFCNVVCNSETVFNHHLAGQKHASMVKKHAVAGATFIMALPSRMVKRLVVIEDEPGGDIRCYEVHNILFTFFSFRAYDNARCWFVMVNTLRRPRLQLNGEIEGLPLIQLEQPVNYMGKRSCCRHDGPELEFTKIKFINYGILNQSQNDGWYNWCKGDLVDPSVTIIFASAASTCFLISDECAFGFAPENTPQAAMIPRAMIAYSGTFGSTTTTTRPFLSPSDLKALANLFTSLVTSP